MRYPSSHTDAGAKSALTDEYARAISDLKTVINGLSDEALCQIVDHETKDEDCRSIQTILSHVVRAGYGYAIAVRKWKGEALDYHDRQPLPTAADYAAALDAVMAYNELLFLDYPDLHLEEHNPNAKINVTWGQRYDVEQLFEHAIVHILRHRRQIEGFLRRMGI
ncbi:DinB family protein [Neolewinella persica]|uniref:DinB family protein n=1 Tax=Neolewinella persica TaxID=70998 RepID=UPI00035C128E|nr:DinB family protein [Neolewinella persica]